MLERWREPLERLGFAFEGFGGQAILLRAVPSLLKGDEPRRLVESAVDELSGPKVGAPAVEREIPSVRSHILGDMKNERPGGQELVREHIHPALSRLQRRLVKEGVERELVSAGARRGDEVLIGNVAFEFIPEGEPDGTA